jgi:phosphoribosyl-AMP cyclohydrolase
LLTTTWVADLTKMIEESSELTPKFNGDGLIPAIATDAESGTVLMLAWMNSEALERTIETGQAWYWSRSRQRLWHKGATSGQIQHVEELRIDCDQDAVWLKVRVAGDGGCCHTGRASCFYRRVVKEPDGPTLRPLFVSPPSSS